MEQLQKARLIKPELKKKEAGVQNPIERDNKAFNIVDGDKKMLDYLDYSSTITKGTLAANGIIKLKPDSYQKYNRDYGAYANPDKSTPPEIPKEEIEEEPFNEWDNIFLNTDTPESSPDSPFRSYVTNY